jgi:hypothetical protein
MINAINKPNNSNKNILVVNNNNNNKDVVNKNESSNNSNTIATNNNNDCDLSETPKNDNMPYIGNINDKQLTKQLNNATVSQNNIEINNNNNNQNQNEENKTMNQTKHSHTIEESKPSLNKINSLNMQNKKDKLQKTSSLIIRDNPNIKNNDNISDTSQNKNKKVGFQVDDKSPKIKHHPQRKHSFKHNITNIKSKTIQ